MAPARAPRARGDTPTSQQTPDSPSLGVAQQKHYMSREEGTLSPPPGLPQPAVFQYYLTNTNILCSLLSTDTVAPLRSNPNTFDISIQRQQELPAGQGRVLLTGLTLALPSGTIGTISRSPLSTLPTFLEIIPGMLDSHPAREFCILVVNNSDVLWAIATSCV